LKNSGSKYLKTHPSPNLGKILPLPFCPRETQFPVKTHFKRISTQVKTSLEPLAPDKLFSKTFFSDTSKTVRDIEKVYAIKFLGLLVYNNLLLGYILVSPTVFEKQGFEKSQKTPPTSDCAAQGRLDSQLRQIF